MAISITDVSNIIQYFSINYRKCNNHEDKKTSEFMLSIESKCQDLFSLDYEWEILDNIKGELSQSYPHRIIIPTSSKSEPWKVFEGDLTNIRDYILTARAGRCWTRFPVPAILFENKFICRSSTLAGEFEIFGRRSFKYVFPSYYEEPKTIDLEESTVSSKNVLIDKERHRDIQLLKLLQVQTIFDLMLEKKKVKYGFKITSSEKTDKENRYSDFTIVGVPYPGCELFKKFTESHYNPQGLGFDWNQSFIDAVVAIPPDSLGNKMEIDWSNYKIWELLHLTQNYLKLILKTIKDGSNGILVHCISGWDRTPLFISLIRLSLWADGKIHQQLSPIQMLYLTLAYDWFSFSHNLVDRLGKGEEIMHFCFEILEHIASRDYSIETCLKDPSNHLSADELQLEDSWNLNNDANFTASQRPTNAKLDMAEWDIITHSDFENSNGNTPISSSSMTLLLDSEQEWTERGSPPDSENLALTNGATESVKSLNREEKLNQVRYLFKRVYLT